MQKGGIGRPGKKLQRVETILSELFLMVENGGGVDKWRGVCRVRRYVKLVLIIIGT